MRMERLLNAQNVPVCGHGKSLLDENGAVTYTELTGDVRFKDVTFGYDEDKIILHDISLFAKPGQKLAFVGSTGAGKTTITNLINRFYDIQSGEILYDGIDITKSEKMTCAVPSESFFRIHICSPERSKDNIRYGKLNATDEEIYNAAKLSSRRPVHPDAAKWLRYITKR